MTRGAVPVPGYSYVELSDVMRSTAMDWLRSGSPEDSRLVNRIRRGEWGENWRYQLERIISGEFGGGEWRGIILPPTREAVERIMGVRILDPNFPRDIEIE